MFKLSKLGRKFSEVNWVTSLNKKNLREVHQHSFLNYCYQLKLIEEQTSRKHKIESFANYVANNINNTTVNYRFLNLSNIFKS